MAGRIVISGVANSIVDLLVQNAEPWLLEQIRSGSFSISQPHPGAVWISIVEGSHLSLNGRVASLYYHPTKQHSASTTGSLGIKRSVAEAGSWAISFQSKAMMGNKANYDFA